MEQTRDRYPDLLVLRSEADFDGYDDATEAFRRGGSQRDLMTRLMKLGMTAAEIRWHAAYPGRRTVAVVEGETMRARFPEPRS
jgi:hypothetical protein